MVITGGPSLPAAVVDQAAQRSVWESGQLGVALAVGTCVVALGVARFRQRTGRRRLGRGLLVLPLVLLVASAAVAVNFEVGYVRNADDLLTVLALPEGGIHEGGRLLQGEAAAHEHPTSTDQVRVQELDTVAPELGITVDRTKVLLPPGYDDPANAGRRYPVTYLVHGYPSGGPDDWLDAGGAVGTLQSLVDTGSAAPLIVVAVDATDGQGTDFECLDVPGGPQLDTFLTGTLVRSVDATFRTLPDRGDRAIGGMSGGGYCALNLALQHLDTYSVLLASEVYDDAGDSVGLLGDDPVAAEANTPRDYLPSMDFPHPLAAMFQAGSAAPSDVERTDRIAAALADRGQEVAVRVEPDQAHTWRNARAGLPFLLAFAAQHFSGSASG